VCGGDEDGSIYVWDGGQGLALGAMPGHTRGITALCCAPAASQTDLVVSACVL
jgi:hypothetical protein